MNNTFTFNGQHYRQINGPALGTKMAPSYANHFMGKRLIQPKIYVKSFPATLTFFQRCLAAFSSPPRIPYRRCKNLRDILVRAKHHRQTPHSALGAFRCHRNSYKTCPFITEGTTSYTFLSTNEQRRTRHKL